MTIKASVAIPGDYLLPFSRYGNCSKIFTIPENCQVYPYFKVYPQQGKHFAFLLNFVYKLPHKKAITPVRMCITLGFNSSLFQNQDRMVAGDSFRYILQAYNIPVFKVAEVIRNAIFGGTGS